MKRFPKTDNGSKLTVGPYESQIRQSMDTKVRNILSALKPVAVSFPSAFIWARSVQKNAAASGVALDALELAVIATVR